jgi:IS30 family transposase
MSYKQLTLEDRHYIQCRLQSGDSIRSIAAGLNRSPSTISREVHRNGSTSYEFLDAQHLSEHRHRFKYKHRRFKTEYIGYLIKRLTKDRWSPELIAVGGRRQFGEFVSHETIYQWIWKMKFSQSKQHRDYQHLYTYLRHGRRKKKRGNRQHSRGNIPGRQWIDQRPGQADARARYGDFEADIVLSKNRKAGALVLLDRSTRYCYVRKLRNKSAGYVRKKIVECLRGENQPLHTITFDNDYAFAEHQWVAEKLNVNTYFTHPYSSQEKGSVENRIGQLRRFLPKGTDFSKISDQYIKTLENKLNNRPMRMFEYLTPAQVRARSLMLQL